MGRAKWGVLEVESLHVRRAQVVHRLPSLSLSLSLFLALSDQGQAHVFSRACPCLSAYSSVYIVDATHCHAWLFIVAVCVFLQTRVLHYCAWHCLLSLPFFRGELLSYSVIYEACSLCYSISYWSGPHTRFPGSRQRVFRPVRPRLPPSSPNVLPIPRLAFDLYPAAVLQMTHFFVVFPLHLVAHPEPQDTLCYQLILVPYPAPPLLLCLPFRLCTIVYCTFGSWFTFCALIPVAVSREVGAVYLLSVRPPPDGTFVVRTAAPASLHAVSATQGGRGATCRLQLRPLTPPPLLRAAATVCRSLRPFSVS